MGNYNIRAALVSTNSITQGESVSILWKPLFESGLHIDFAYRTFIWDSEASIKAHVHCVIAVSYTHLDVYKRQALSILELKDIGAPSHVATQRRKTRSRV